MQGNQRARGWLSVARFFFLHTVDFGIYYKHTMLNKLQASFLLGVAPNAIDKFVAEGRLHVLWSGSNTIPFYDEAEVLRLKKELATQSQNELSPNLSNFIDTLKVLNKLADALRPLKNSREPYKGAFTIQGASSISGLSVSTLRKDIKEGRLKARKIDNLWRIARSDFYRYFKDEWRKD